MNGLVLALLRSPLHFFGSRGLLIISWKGRRTGKAFSIPAGYKLEPGGLFVLISKREEKQWWRNFSTPWPAKLAVRGQQRPAIGEVVTVGSHGFYDRCEEILNRLPWMASQFGGFKFDPSEGLDDEQRRLLDEHAGVVRFRFADDEC